MHLILFGNLPSGFPCEHCRNRRQVPVKALALFITLYCRSVKRRSRKNLRSYRRRLFICMLPWRLNALVISLKSTRQKVWEDGGIAWIRQGKRCFAIQHHFGKIHKQPALCCRISSEFPDRCFDFSVRPMTAEKLYQLIHAGQISPGPMSENGLSDLLVGREVLASGVQKQPVGGP